MKSEMISVDYFEFTLLGTSWFRDLQPYDMRWVLVRFIRLQPCVHLALTMFGAQPVQQQHSGRLMVDMAKI